MKQVFLGSAFVGERFTRRGKDRIGPEVLESDGNQLFQSLVHNWRDKNELRSNWFYAYKTAERLVQFCW